MSRRRKLRRKPRPKPRPKPSEANGGRHHSHDDYVPGGVLVLALDNLPTSLDFDCAPEETTVCVNARLELFRRFLARAEYAMSRYDPDSLLRRIVQGTDDEQTVADWDQCGRDFLRVHHWLINESGVQGFGIGHEFETSGPHYTLYCAHQQCDRHSTQGLSIPSPVPSMSAKDVPA